jgi:hypothetical protein
MSRQTFRLILRVAGLAAVTAALLFAVFAWVVFQRGNELILTKLETFLRENQSGYLEVGSLDLRVLRNFPNLTLEIDSISYYEQADSLRSIDTLPIFQAEKLSLALRLFPLIRGEVIISEIGLENSQVNIQEDRGGTLNIDRAFARPAKVKPVAKSPAAKKTAPIKPKTPSPPGKKAEAPEAAQLKLEEAAFSNVHITWHAYHQARPQRITVNSLTVSLDRKDTLVAASIKIKCIAEELRLNRARVPSGAISLEAKAQLHPETGRMDFRQATLTLDAFTIALSGYYHHRNNRMLDLEVDASSNDLPFLSRLLNKNVLPGKSDLIKAGDIFLKGRVFGALATEHPQADLVFGVSNLSFTLPGTLGAFKGLGFEGRLSTGTAPDYSRAILDIRNIRGTIPGGFIKGDIYLSNLVRPYLRCKLQSQLNLEGYDKVFNIDRVTDLKGQAMLNAQVAGPLRFLGLKPSDPKPFFDITFDISGLSFRLAGRQEFFEDLGIKGRWSSGPDEDFTKSFLQFKSIQGKIPGGGIAGDLLIANLLQPVLHYRVAAEMRLDGYDQLLNTESIEDLRGHLSLKGQFDGPLALIGTHAMDSSRSSQMRLDSVSFVYRPNQTKVTGLTGFLENSNNVATVQLGGRYAASTFRLKATIENLMHRLIQGERSIDARGTLEVDKLFSRDLLLDSLRQPLIDDMFSEISLGFRLDAESDTARDHARLRFSIDNLSAKLDKLPDIRRLTTSGILVRHQEEYQLTIDAFRLALPQGKLELAGKADFLSKKQLVTKASIKFREVPWEYILELSDEIRENAQPSRKNMPVNQLTLIDTELNVSADLRTYPFDFNRLEFRDSQFKLSLPNGNVFSTDRLTATFKPLQFLHPPNSGAIIGLRSVQGNLAFEKLKIPGLIDLTLSMEVNGRDDVLNADLINSSAASSQTGRLAINLGPEEPEWSFHYEVDRMPAEVLVSRFHKGKFLEGPIDYTIDLSTRGGNWSSAVQNLDGTLEVRSDSMRIYGIDIDDILQKFQKSQRINLTDIGAVVLVGPLGIVATKGSDFVVLASTDLNINQSTRITKLLTRWDIHRQTLTSEDVAIATTQNRLALDGSINFEKDSIPGIRVAVVDKNGCALMDQQLYGKFGELKAGKLNVAKTLLGSVINFVDVIVGKDCKPVYTGNVSHPKVSK